MLFMEISAKNKEKISEQILAHLYSINPRAVFTVQIARELARDEEFIKQLLINLKKKGLVVEIGKNSKGILYLKRKRWQLSDEAYNIYQMNQTNYN
ncbi:MAG: hypothetical protein QT10_C0001G0167 [archaeon GW2011_AR19]|nr:MAG: hypothetical protein QT10_C0001G0167 [archaeon GW2011_AR19]